MLAVLLVISFVRPIRAAIEMRRRRKAGLMLYGGTYKGKRTSAGGAGVGYAAVAGSVVAGALLVVSVVLFFGWFVFMLLWLLGPEVALEHDARLRLQQRHLHDAQGEPATT